ncbi:MAG: type IV pilin [Salinirussus sp.]
MPTASDWKENMIPTGTRRIRHAERAVSPVIAVVLLVGVTMVLAAVVATFAFGYEDHLERVPRAAFSFDQHDGTVTVTHQGGSTLDANNVDIRVDGTTVTPDDRYASRISAGGSATVTGLSPGETVRVVWESDDGSRSITLAAYEVE